MQGTNVARSAVEHTTAEPAGKALIDHLIDSGFVDRWARLFATRHGALERTPEIADRIVGTIAKTPLPLALYLADRDAKVHFAFDQARQSVEDLIGTPVTSVASLIGDTARAQRALRAELAGGAVA